MGALQEEVDNEGLCSVNQAVLCLLWRQVGALEYDPELPARQRHREWLAERVVFKEVVPIQDAALRAKIHQTYRLSYIKDVVLPRVLDDATFATFSSLILFNNVEVQLFFGVLGFEGMPLPGAIVDPKC